MYLRATISQVSRSGHTHTVAMTGLSSAIVVRPTRKCFFFHGMWLYVMINNTNNLIPTPRECIFADFVLREMILDAIQSLRDKNGSSLQAVRKWIATTYPDTQNKQKASFNQLTLKGITKLVAEGSVEKNKSSFRLSRQFLSRLKDDQRDQYIGLDLGKGRKKFVYAPGMELVGTSMEHNKVLRKELAEAREKRDKYLSVRMEVRVHMW